MGVTTLRMARMTRRLKRRRTSAMRRMAVKMTRRERRRREKTRERERTTENKNICQIFSNSMSTNFYSNEHKQQVRRTTPNHSSREHFLICYKNNGALLLWRYF